RQRPPSPDRRLGSRRELKNSTPAAVGRHALVGNPHSLRQRTGLPEYVDWNAAARVPVTADPEPLRLDPCGNPLADHDRAILMEGAVIAETCDIKLQRLRFQQPLAGDVVDDEVRKIGLAGDRT